MGCFTSKPSRLRYEDPHVLASETSFSVSDVEALYQLFERISCSIVKDHLIHKEEFQLALFRNPNKTNLFADRVFHLFDYNGNGVIEFGEFVRSLSVFHPNTSFETKVSFAFRLYDLRCSGYIERDEVKKMVLAVLHESEIPELPDYLIDMIVEKAFCEADVKGDGRIDPEEWHELVSKYPSLIKNMTLPYLKDITLSFPSFVEHAEVYDKDL